MTFEQQRQDYFGALGWVAELMAGTTPERLGDATPCAEYDVGHLIARPDAGWEQPSGCQPATSRMS